MKSGIRQRMIRLFLFGEFIPLTLIMVSVFLLAWLYFSREQHRTETNLLYQFGQNIETEIHQIERGAYYPYENSDAFQALTRPYSPAQRDAVYQMLQSVSFISDSISAVRIDALVHNRTYLFANHALFTADSVTENRADSVLSFDSLHMFTASSLARLTNLEGNPVFSITNPLYLVPKDDLIGCLTIDIDPGWIRELADQMVHSHSERVEIVTKDGGVIFDSDDPEGVSLDEYRKAAGLIENRSGSAGENDGYFRDDGRLYYYRVLKLNAGTLYVVKSAPERFWIFLLFALACLAIYMLFAAGSLIYIRKSSAEFTAPIINLTEQIRNVEQGEPYERCELDGTDEVSILNNTFYEMIGTIETMRIKEYEMKLMNRSNQLRMLQAQLNPHFMNNSLQSLGTMALETGSPKLYGLILKLSRMMNYAMDIDHVLVPLREEIEYAENYLAFQRRRFGDDLHTSIEADPGTDEMIVPKMIIQPVMENYFKHGFVKRDGGYVLQTRAFTEGECLVICIWNNGVNLAGEDLIQINERLRNPDSSREGHTYGIGLGNISSRLNLYYGDNGCIVLKNCEPEGLEVRITMPIRTSETDAGPEEENDNT